MQFLERQEPFSNQNRERRPKSSLSNPTAYYRQMAALALRTRSKYAEECYRLDLNSVRKIFKKEGIRLDYWDIRSARIRAMYICDECGYTVMIKNSLPREPKLFALLHELKHHLVDQEAIISGKFVCGDYNENQLSKRARKFLPLSLYIPN